MTLRDEMLARRLTKVFEGIKADGSLPGLRSARALDTLVAQLVSSSRRVWFLEAMSKRSLSPLRASPEDQLFDPLLAAMILRSSDLEEACWLVFLSVHCGKSTRSGWRLAASLYGGLGDGRWTWERVLSDCAAFRSWLGRHQMQLRAGAFRFGNHRKYQSLDADTASGTGAAVTSYVAWVQTAGSHRALIGQAAETARGDPLVAFEILYTGMASVASFGRTGRFDYVTTLGKLGLAHVRPGSAYLQGATGPKRGAQLLFGTHGHAREVVRYLNQRVIGLANDLEVTLDVLEDALCNWQKSPTRFVAFRG